MSNPVPAPESDEVRALKERLRQAAEENREAWEALVGQFRPTVPVPCNTRD
jgi:hypothetical protein